MTDYDDEGYLTDMYGHQIGVCNACGEERRPTLNAAKTARSSPPVTRTVRHDLRP